MNPSIRTMLSPADGLEAKQDLFSESPIEALDWLHELGQIAKASIEPEIASLAEFANEAAEPTEVSTPIVTVAAEATAPVVTAPAAPENPPVTKTEDSRLIDALMEYHRLRGPALGARTAPRPSKGTEFTPVDGSVEPTERFSPLDVPVVKNAEPKGATGGVRSNRPTQTILRPKPRS